MEEKVVIMNSSEAKNLNENEYFTAYFNDVIYVQKTVSKIDAVFYLTG